MDDAHFQVILQIDVTWACEGDNNNNNTNIFNVPLPEDTKCRETIKHNKTNQNKDEEKPKNWKGNVKQIDDKKA